MAKNTNNNNKKEEIKKDEILEGMEIENPEVEAESTENNPNVPEHSDRVRELVGKMKEFVGEFERGWSIKRLEPLKDEINKILEENKEKDFLSKSDRNFLYFVNRVIYGKVNPPAWRRQAEEEKENNRPENAPPQLQFRTLNDKVERLKQTLEGYGNKNIITCIEDIKEKAFYCLKETEVEGKMELECSLKYTVQNGVAAVAVMTPEEAYAMRDEYRKIKDLPEERNNISYNERVINNNPTHADNYFIKIATAKEKDVEYVNSQTLDQDMVEEQ